MTFKDLGLGDKLLSAITDSGYTTPTPIQEKAIPYVLMGRDVLGCAQTGTGKTASFTLPMIDILAEGRAKARMPRSLIIAPTRELAAQVAETFERYGKYHKLSKALLIGGSSFAEQEQKLDRGVDVLIATPGRLLDLFERGKILLADVRILVIDEADRMLDMGFIPDVERIVSLLPTIRQTLFFSATMPKEIRRLADQFLMNPKEVSVAPPASPAETVTQGLVRCPGQDKRKALLGLLEREPVSHGLVFCNRKRDISSLAKALRKAGHSVSELHGDMAQPARMETLQRFRDGEIKLLVCSDVAARGLDIPAVSHVFNYDVPGHPEDYVHRIGRTGRAGRSGRAFMLATPADGKYLAAIETTISGPIPPVEIEQVRILPPEAVEGDIAESAPAEPAAKGRRRRRGGGGKAADAQEARSGDAAAGTARSEAPGAPVADDEQDGTPPAHAAKNKQVRQSEKQKAETQKADGQKAEKQKAKEKPVKGKAKSNQNPEKQQSSNGRQSKPFGDHTPAFLLRPVPESATA